MSDTLKPWQKWALYGAPFIIFMAISAFLLKGLFIDPQHLPSARIGKEMPRFALADLLNPGVVLSEQDLKGTPALLNVWATWCPACRQEHSELNRLAQEEGVTLYGLNYKDEPEAARAYLEQLGNPYRYTLQDEEGRLGFDLGVYGAPETYVLDRDGKIHHRLVGIVTREKWLQELKPIMDRL